VTLTDCWPDALLVSPPNASQTETAPEIGVVDWEFASIGRGLNGDLAQLLGQFAMMECAADCNADAVRGQQLAALVSAISDTYRQVSAEEGSVWTAGGGNPGADRFAALDPNGHRAKLLRSAFLMHGIEIMHWALVKPWNCQNPACMVGPSHTTAKHECMMVQSMVRRAIWHLRHAKEDEHEFCSPENCIALQQAYADGQWLLNLF